MYFPRIGDFVRSAKRDHRLSALSMDRHHDMTFVPLLMLLSIEPAALFNEPCATITGL